MDGFFSCFDRVQSTPIDDILMRVQHEEAILYEAWYIRVQAGAGGGVNEARPVVLRLR